MRSLTSALLLVPLSALAQTWVQLPDLPGTPRDDAASFSMIGKVFVGTGLDTSFALRNDWFAFDEWSSTWDIVAPLPATGRQYCSTFQVDGYAYLFGGIDGNGPLNELWRYDPVNDTWEQRASLPAPGRYASTVIDDIQFGFICTGMLAGGIPTNETWRYDPSIDTWIQRASLPGPSRHRASFAGGQLIGGADSAFQALSDAYLYTALTDTWTQQQDIPLARFAADGVDGFLIGGASDLATVHADVLNYHWTTETWSASTFPSFAGGPRRGGVSGITTVLADAGLIYYGTGSDNLQRYNDWWRLFFETGIEERIDDVINVRPNPATDHITLSSAALLAGLQCDLVDDLGRTVISTPVPLDGRMELRTLAPGRYTILVHGRDLILRSSFIKLP
ncbi:MAG: hypothetical protein IPG69_13125 [Flavobacteriales bacterium]|nr:hypothetical protein [Flavobacteriales bacterium]